MSETQLVKSILAALAIEPGVVAWRNSVGSRGFRKFGLGTGSADIIACVAPHGRFVGIECKVPDGIMSEPQYEWGMTVRSRGGVYGVVYSVAEARRLIASARSQTAIAGGCAAEPKHSRVAGKR